MEKKEICLVISDIDNTVSDTFNIWGNALDKAVNALCALHGMNRKDMEKTLLASVPENRKGSSGPLVGINLASDIEQTKELHGKTPEEHRFFAKEHAKIVHSWQKERDKAVLYDGVLPVVRKIKASGAQFVLFTDARESACITRLDKMGFPPELIDKIYVQPDIENIPATPFKIKNDSDAFKKAMKSKTVVLSAHSAKPNLDNMHKIMADMKIQDPSQVVMVGDNIRSDGGCGIGIGADFAWQKKGTEVSLETTRCYEKFAANPDYKIGTEAHLSQMNKKNKPTVVLENGFADLAKYYHFTAPQKKQERLAPALLKRLAAKLKKR